MRVKSAKQSDNILAAIAAGSLAELMSIWRSLLSENDGASPDVFRALTERILVHGEPLLAFDVVNAGLSKWPKDIRLRQLQGLALARSGATERANAVLESLRTEGQGSEETLGMLGRTYKDLAENAQTEEERRKCAARAAEIYGEAYRKSGGYWSGINAATMSLLVGDEKAARQLAGKVKEQCLREVADPSGDSYWEFAALGEAALICREWEEAKNWYARAAKVGGTRFGDFNSSRRNARLILRHLNQDEHLIDQCLTIPGVVVFAGHMIDRPGRAAPRFPQELEETIGQEIRRRLADLNPGFGFSSAACGSDILFLEAMLERGAEISLVLPYQEDEFVADSVELGPDARKWRSRFDKVVSRAARVITASKQRLEIGGISYQFCNQMMLGLAAIHSRRLSTELVPLAVWNGQPGDDVGGTASVVEMWRSLGYKPAVIGLPESSGKAGVRVANDTATVVPREVGSVGCENGFESRIVSILFADAVGFSKLTEPEIPPFVQNFLGAIARLSESFAETILARNTWGDGLYFIFADVRGAGDFALELANIVCETDWLEKGLPAEMGLRIALHAGPAYEFLDPITGLRTFGGSHVSRAARIEPITPRGHVYASEAFAALAAAENVAGFMCEYVGQTPMAKGYGTFPVYHVRRQARR